MTSGLAPRHITGMDTRVISQRIDQRLTALRLSAHAACLRAGLHQDAIRSIRRGQTPRVDRLEKLAAALEVSLDWLLHGTSGTDAPTDDAATQPLDIAAIADMAPSRATPPARARNLPVHGAASGQPDAFIFDGRAQEWIARPEALDGAPNGYAVYVRGDSMQPRYLAGELVYVNPNRPVTPGCYAVVLIRQGDGAPLRGLIRQYVGQDAETVTLRSLHPAAEVAHSTRDIAAIHRIVGATDG